MGFIIKSAFVLMLAASPVYLLNSFVMPALEGLAQNYSSFDETAQSISGTNP